jgi:hypothetical protein
MFTNKVVGKLGYDGADGIWYTLCHINKYDTYFLWMAIPYSFALKKPFFLNQNDKIFYQLIL